MEKTEYEIAKKGMGASIRMNLETIRKNLYDHKAACLVGAGFSKNAEMDEDTYMKDWLELGVDFYQSLYGDDYRRDDLNFKSVLRLASQVEAAKGRAALESLLQHALPNERVYPGRLHVDLMRLPWNDVFTTNYDTLLEKSCVDADRYYYKVTNKETLLYTPHPRIVKLHGSFPDIRPFIITEEDFRTYPQKFPEFVNTVRQSLIENVLCLIGFSGDDPNFLSWIGWIRDVIGNQASPVFQITFDKQLHDSTVLLSHNLGIVVVNLAEIPSLDGYSKALDFLFTYLAQEYQSLWNGSISANLSNTPTKEEIKKLTQRMQFVRTSYPGWYMLPPNHMQEFKDVQHEYPFMGSILECQDLTREELIDYLFELDWRIDIVNASKNVDWYCKTINQLPNDKDDMMNIWTYRKILSLKISLLENYRTILDVDNYNALRMVIQRNSNHLTYEQKRSFTYQQAMFAISLLDYDEANNLLNVWQLRSMDYLGALWKSCIMTEVGRKHEAESLLKDMLRSVKQNILSNTYSPALMSARSAIELFIWILNPMNEQRPTVNKDFDYYGVLDNYRNSITKCLVKPVAMRLTHGFNILSTGRQWNGGENGFLGDFSGAYGYFKAHEKLGLPLGIVGGIGMDLEAKKNVLINLAKYEIGYCVSLLIRCSNKNLLEHVMSRAMVKRIEREYADLICDRYLETCIKVLESEDFNELKTRVITVLLPCLTRLSVKLSPDRNNTLFGQWIEVYRHYPHFFDATMLWTLFWNTSGDDLASCVRMAIELPISMDDTRRDLSIPTWNIEKVSLSDEVISAILIALESDQKVVVDRAYNRLKLLAECSLTDEQRTNLIVSVDKWRKKESLTDPMMLSLAMFPPVSNKEKVYRVLIQTELKAFIEEPFVNERSSIFVDKFVNFLVRLQPLYDFMTYDEHEQFVHKVILFLTDNENWFKKDDSDEWFGGFHGKISSIFDVLGYYTGREALPNSESVIWEELLQILLRYKKYNYPVMLSVTHLYFFAKKDKTRLKTMVGETLFHDHVSLVQDASNAFVYMAIKQRSRVNQLLIKRVIGCITYTFDEKTSVYLEMLLLTLVNGGVSKEAKQQLMNYMDSFPRMSSAVPDEDERKVDIEYYANMLAGAMSILMPEWSGLLEWNNYKESMFNDVRSGFEKGILVVQKTSLC